MFSGRRTEQRTVGYKWLCPLGRYTQRNHSYKCRLRQQHGGFGVPGYGSNK